MLANGALAILSYIFLRKLISKSAPLLHPELFLIHCSLVILVFTLELCKSVASMIMEYDKMNAASRRKVKSESIKRTKKRKRNAERKERGKMRETWICEVSTAWI